MSQRNFTKDKDQAFAHQANIERYRKLLRTYLTDNERSFVQRRLAEEQTALRQLGSGRSFASQIVPHFGSSSS